jgi:uncharacterized FAD-dependent dehydrogenase
MTTQQVDVRLLPEEINNVDLIRAKLALELDEPGEAFEFEWLKRSLDARKKSIFYNCRFVVYPKGQIPNKIPLFHPKDVRDSAYEVVIIGAGPAGLFAALQCLELGIRPIIYERGKDVRARRRDLADLNKIGKVNPDSNYCFGEGGAGTYSDGKLYTRSKKRGNVLKVLQWFVHFGASQDIQIDAHPHIGTNKLPRIISSMRECIETHGGKVCFSKRLTDIELDKQSIRRICFNEGEWVSCHNLILATGHSARDIYYLLHERRIAIQAKSFALGVRIEHSQDLIDRIQYHGAQHNVLLPPAAYSLVSQVNGRGVYSFCMCPGGIIAPCATAEGEVVTNGWSPSKRNNPYANSGIVVGVFPEDFSNFESNPLVCLEFQKQVEQRAFELAGGNQRVPAQRLIDFLDGIPSSDFPKTSYHPGIKSVNLKELFPLSIYNRLSKGFVDFGKKMKGFLTNEAVVHAPESRTSSPVLIPRKKEDFEHTQIKGLYPCGEGAGYAGGIVSAAIDGINVVQAIALKYGIIAEKN